MPLFRIFDDWYGELNFVMMAAGLVPIDIDRDPTRSLKKSMVI